MTLSFRNRLFATQTLLVTLALALVTLLVLQQQHRWVVRDIEDSLGVLARSSAATLPARADWDSVAHALGPTLDCRVTLMAADGRLLGDSEVPAGRLGQVENHAGRPEMKAALAGRIGHDVRRSRTLGRDLLYTAVPVPGNGAVAVLRLAKPLHAAALLAMSLLGLSLAGAAIALLVSAPLLHWAAGRHAARIGELERVARQLAAGDPAARARETPEDELGRLGRAMNEMAAEARARLAALERERDERERILAHMSDGVVLLDGEERVVRMNRALADLVGMPLPADPGTHLREYARIPELDELIEAAASGAHSVERDLRLWSAGQRPVHATATPLGSSSPGAVLLVLHDLTEEERLNRVRQDFVANVSHELRTPLTSLRGYAETLLEGALNDPENRERFVRVIHDQAVRLEALSQDLLALADLERPAAAVRPEPLDLREVTEKQVASFRARAAAAGLTVELEPGPPVPALADRARMEQVLANLLDNAVKYTEQGGVKVTLGLGDERAWCEVADTGPGIPDEDQPRVFERFYRVDKARSREKGGTGLGLSIVKHIVALHGGEVSLRSQPGVGSVFRFEVPRSGPAAT